MAGNRRCPFTVCMHIRPCCLREEFTNYMFLERAQEAAGMSSENWRLFPQVGAKGQGQLGKQVQHGDLATCMRSVVLHARGN